MSPSEYKEKAIKVALGTFLLTWEGHPTKPSAIVKALVKAQTWYDKKLKNLAVQVWHPFKDETPANVAILIKTLANNIYTLEKPNQTPGNFLPHERD